MKNTPLIGRLSLVVALVCVAVSARAAEPVPSAVSTAPAAGAAPGVAATTQPVPQIAISVSKDEKGQPQLCATITLADKPLENATVDFYVCRTFGNLLVGEDHTLDDGSAAVKFPEKLPGDAQGQLQVLVKVQAGPNYAQAKAQTTTGGGRIIKPLADPFPRAFWASYAPVWLVCTIVILFSGVWITYAFVIGQIIAIKKEGAGRKT